MPLPRPTLRRKPLPQAPVPAALRRRLQHGTQRIAAQGRFAAQVRAARAVKSGPMAAIAGAALLGGAGGVGLMLAALQASWPLAAAAAGVAGAGAWLGLRVRRSTVP